MSTETQPRTADAPASVMCDREYFLPTSQGTHVMLCYLPAGHDGPHYDEADDLTWTKGRPDGQ